MKKILTTLILLLALVCMLCGCGAGNKGPVISLDTEDQELLETLGSDIQVIAPADFAKTVQAMDAGAAGQLYQLTGYFQAAAEGEENPTLGNARSKPGTSIALRFLTVELTAGDQYTVTGVISAEEHDGHVHMGLDVLTIESYTAK